MSQDQTRKPVAVNGYTITILGHKHPQALTIKGRLPGLNEYTTACRTNPHKGNEMKRQAQETVMWHILSTMRGLRFTKPVFLIYRYYEKDRRRDHDNVSSFAHKVVQDALVKCGTLADDGWSHVTGNIDFFEVDPDNPRIVVEFIEQEVAPCKERHGKKSKS